MMKKSLFVFTMIIAGLFMLPAQQTPNMPTSDKYYKTTWKKIDSLQQKGKVRDALSMVEELMAVAKKEANALQRIKGLGTKIELIQPIEEQSDSLSLALIQGELAESKGMAQSLLQTMLGDYYYQYYQQHRWRINERTSLDVSAEDFTTWDVQTLMEAAATAYLHSIKNDSLLKEVPIRTLREILDEGKDSYKYRPTLYDVLAHRAIDFFQNPETRLARSANEFELPAEKAFLPAAEFAEQTFEGEYAYDRNLQAVQLLQDLINFHLNTEEPEPLVEVDLKRLAFAREIAIGEQKDTLYLRALEQLKARYEGESISTSITYPIAELYQERARKYNPFEPESPYKWDLKRAWDIAEEASQAFPESEGAALCRNLQLEIEQRSLELQTAEAVVPDQEFLTFCRYRNLEKLFVRVAALSEATEKELADFGYNQRKEKVQFMQQLPVYTSSSMDLPEDPDYQAHSVELPMPELPVGRYLLMVSDHSSFSTDEHVLAYGMVSVTELSCLTESRPEGMQVFVQNRESGKPEKKVTVQLMRYEYESRRYKPVGEPQETPKDGRILLPYDGDNYGNYAISLTQKDDHFRTDGFGGRYRDYEPYMQPVLTYFFLDRKLYRPGQTIYFKGLMMARKGESYDISPNKKTEVTFVDANNQKVKTLELTTNEYGTFSGSFTAPRSGLMGRMRINGEGGSSSFHVEEYKRPTFEVTFDTLEGSYRLGEEIVAVGEAKAYAGSALSFAEVRYRVRREARFPYWGWRWWLPQPSSPAREIASGTVRADANGKFEIPFTLVPDGTLSKDEKPIFTYIVEADVIDLTGETRSGNTRVQAGYVALDVSLDMPSTLRQDGLAQASIQSHNLAGKEEKAEGTVDVYRLKEPGRLLRQRQWSQPDKYLMSQEAFAERFPHDAYGNQLEPKRWEKGEKVLSLSFNTAENKQLDLSGLAKAEPGMYRFELSTEDQYGTEIRVTAFSTLEEADAKSPALPEPLDYALDQEDATYEPGETARLKVRTSARKAYVLYKIVRDEEVLREGIEKIKNRRPLELEIPIQEMDRGGLAVQLSLVYANRPLTYQVPITVPWSNKQLSLEWGTFRSKLRPGQEEEWTIKLKGPKGEKVAAEMVAALYDASLDALGRPNHYSPISLFPSHRPRSSMSGQGSFGSLSFQRIANNFNRRPESVELHGYDQLNLLGDSRYFGGGRIYSSMELRESMNMPLMAAEEAPRARGLKSATPAVGKGEDMAGAPMAEMDGDGVPDTVDQEPAEAAPLDDVPVRKNLNETAFFFPHLQSDEEGNFVLKFTMPEALTRWKFLSFAHSKSLQSGVLNGETVTQKELMVTPNVPRFLRKGDALTLPAKVANLSEQALSGTAQLFLFDAFTMEDVSSKFGKLDAVQRFSAEAGQNAALSWDLTVPNDVPAVVVQVVARAGDFSDGEEHILPILSNRMLVTESIPLTVRGGETKNFSLRKLVINPSATIEHQRLTLEFTSNPAWYAVQALPYLMEYPHECSEQVFSRFYANALASHVATSQPRIKQIFDQWRQQSENDAEARGALLSSLETNQELKGVLLEETPWLLNARDESERKQRVALLFDLNRMADELGRAKRKLSELQNGDGGFSWFPGMRSSPYITNLIVTGMGHLQKLGVGMATGDPEVSNMISQAIPYLDGELKKSYTYLQSYVKKEDMAKNHLSNWAVQYLYMRSFYPEVAQAEGTEEAFAYYAGQAESYWNEKNHYMQGMLSLVFHRQGNSELGRDVLNALRQQAVWNPELGMYWKNQPGYFWFEASVERQALLIEAFHEVGKDLKTVEEMKLWLLRNKQTNEWETTRATVAACNALLMVGKDLLADTQPVEISVGGVKVDPAERSDAKVEAGTGYFKTAWQRGEIRNEMGNVTVSKKGEGIAWGALYWQYFEDMDKITYAETPLKIKKALFVEKNTPEGPKLTALGKQSLQAGDKVIVRIELRVDRDMEYVHMKDQRAAGFEPINVLSQYKYQDGLGYYESTRDAATHFFFSRLRGNETYVFEYPLRVNQAGDFSNGITTVQCMYAPEFTSHSEGMRVKVEKR